MFTGWYGLIPYIKQITFHLLKVFIYIYTKYLWEKIRQILVWINVLKRILYSHTTSKQLSTYGIYIPQHRKNKAPHVRLKVGGCWTYSSASVRQNHHVLLHATVTASYTITATIGFNHLPPNIRCTHHPVWHTKMPNVRHLTLRLLMSYIYGAPILDVSRPHTTHHSR